MLWLDYVDRHFEHVPFIGKADDDVWVRGDALPHLLRKGYDLLPPSQSVYIGRMENYVRDAAARLRESSTSWPARVLCTLFTLVPLTRARSASHAFVPSQYWNDKPNNEGAIGFSFKFSPCMAARPREGPFEFAKGPLFFVSRSLGRAVSAWANATGEAAEFIRDDERRCYQGSKASKARGKGPCQGTAKVQPPVEDVWLGHAISLTGPLAGPITHLDLEVSLVTVVPWGFWARESIVVWHSNADQDFGRRAALLSCWAANTSRTTRCADWENVRLTCSSPQLPSWADASSTTTTSTTARTCAGQPLRRCALKPPAGCATDKVDLWRPHRRT